MTELQAAFAEGDAPALLRHAATHVEIALFGASKLYSQGQALYVMQDFFGKHPPDKFVFRDYAHTKGGSFAEGDYWSRRSERPLRVYVRLRVQGDDWEVREVLIEERRR